LRAADDFGREQIRHPSPLTNNCASKEKSIFRNDQAHDAAKESSPRSDMCRHRGEHLRCTNQKKSRMVPPTERNRRQVKPILMLQRALTAAFYLVGVFCEMWPVARFIRIRMA
jgi:hypothetical protein